jgi:hypothetical protein
MVARALGIPATGTQFMGFQRVPGLVNKGFYAYQIACLFGCSLFPHSLASAVRHGDVVGNRYELLGNRGPRRTRHRPECGYFGNTRVSQLRTFWCRGWEKARRLQLRFEWFNFFNHTQFLNPPATVNVPAQFGIVNGTLDPRILQIGAKIYW